MSDVEVKQRLMRPFVKRAMATANGWWDGTTIVAPQVPAVGEFGLGEADDFWRDAEILTLTGDMKDQLRRVTGYVQATGTLTLDHRFNHPDVSLLTVNSPAGDQIIDVVDASLFTGGSVLTADALFGALVVDVVDASGFRRGNAVIEDNSPAAEMVVITNVDVVLNRLTLVAPGITNVGGYLVANAAVIAMQNNGYIFDAIGTAESVTILGVDTTLNQVRISMPGIIAAGGYNVAAGAAISMSPQILGPIVGPPSALGTMFLIMTPLMMTGADGSRIQLTDWVDDGEVYPDGSIPVAPAKVTLAAFDDLANVAAVADAAIVGLNADHRGQGAFSTEWNKLGTGVLGGVAYTPPAALDLGIYSTHSKVMAFLYIPTPVGGTITNLYIALGTDAANLFYWTIPAADIVYDAWHHYHLIMSEVSGVLLAGADLSAIQHVGVYVTTNIAAVTVTGILVDDVIVKRVFDQMINQEEGEVIYTEDSGVHTNPRAYEKDNGFVSNPIAVVGPAATLLWAPGTPCVRNPSGVAANGRTAGNITTVYTMELRNPNAAVQTAWLETAAAAVVSIVYELNANDSLVINFHGGKTFGDIDLYINGSVVAIECQLEGTEL